MKINDYATYKDGRIVKIIQIDLKRNTCEVIIGKWNPFWVSIFDLQIN